MASVQLREFTTTAEMMAARAELQMKWRSLKAPPPKPIPMPRTLTLSKPHVEEPPLVPPQPKEDLELICGPLTMRQICNAVSRHTKIGPRDLASARRTANVVRPRQMAMYLIKTLTGFSFPQIGRFLGGRDHTTILHGVNKMAQLRKLDRKLDADLRAIETDLIPPPVTTADPNQLALPLAGEGG